MMNQIEIGKFIAKCRKEKKLTQAQLAEKLNITDRAVSKWEMGKNMPDTSIMLELCEILGITVNELLSGEKIDMENYEKYEKKVDENLIALKRKDENNMTKNGIISILFSALLFIGIVVCFICDIAISNSLTWSLIAISSIVFVWAIFFPSIILGKRGVIISLISLSIVIIPYLFLLSNLIKVKEVFSVGTVLAVASIVFLWIIVAIFSRMGKTRGLAALGITFLLGIPFEFIINIILSRIIGESPFDIWDILKLLSFTFIACISFICDYVKNKGLTK